MDRRSGVAVLGREHIDDSWARNKNKDGIQNAEPLFAAVEEALSDLLKRAERAGSEMRSAAFTREVEAAVNVSLVNDAKARRGSGTESGTKRPTGTGGKHKDAASKQPGATMPRGRTGAVRLDYQRLGDPGDVGHGRVDGGTVTLNLDCAAVVAARDTGNVLAAKVLVDVLLAMEATHRDGKQLRLNVRVLDDADAHRRFGTTFGSLASSVAQIDGRDTLALARGAA